MIRTMKSTTIPTISPITTPSVYEVRSPAVVLITVDVGVFVAVKHQGN